MIYSLALTFQLLFGQQFPVSLIACTHWIWTYVQTQWVEVYQQWVEQQYMNCISFKFAGGSFYMQSLCWSLCTKIQSGIPYTWYLIIPQMRSENTPVDTHTHMHASNLCLDKTYTLY